MWVVAGKSVIGTAHKKTGLPCQDFCGVRLLESPCRLLLAISDGAGSAKHADKASKMAVDCLLNLMAAYTGELTDIGEKEVLEWMAGVKTALQTEADSVQGSLRDFSCTLLGAIIQGSNGYFWQIGDGGWIVHTKGKKNVEVAIWPFSGEYINETVFVTSEDASEKWAHAFLPEIDAVLGFSDGIEHLVLDFPGNRAHEPFVRKIFTSLHHGVEATQVENAIEELLSSDLINERTDDDKTMVLAWANADPENAS